ncbi:MAG: LptF/LptG family permease [Candidatus Lambdaproteobacteria bacterium]|nr:LptF/LptG family permease [Candidatus Lambdaproteobacteria bacterium]
MILHRATLLELLPVFFITTAVLTAVLMMEKVYRLISLMVDKGFAMSETGRMLVFLLPQVITVTLPLGVVGAIFITVIRQSLDSEIICIRSSGRSLWNYALPFVAFGVLATGVQLLFSLLLQPAGIRAFNDLQVRLVKTRAEQNLVPGALNYEFGDKVIRVGAREGNREFSSIFIADREMTESSGMILASHGRIEVDEEAKQVVFRLRDGTIYSMGETRDVMRTTRFGTLNYILDFEPTESLQQNQYWGLSSGELLRRLRTLDEATIRHQRLWLELYIRISTPWSCLAFALASLPMAMVEPRSGRKSSMARAILLVVAYYVIWISFKDLAAGHKVSPAALWLPPMLMALYGLLRLWQTNRDLDLRFAFWRTLRLG